MEKTTSVCSSKIEGLTCVSWILPEVVRIKDIMMIIETMIQTKNINVGKVVTGILKCQNELKEIDTILDNTYDFFSNLSPNIKNEYTGIRYYVFDSLNRMNQTKTLLIENTAKNLFETKNIQHLVSDVLINMSSCAESLIVLILKLGNVNESKPFDMDYFFRDFQIMFIKRSYHDVRCVPNIQDIECLPNTQNIQHIQSIQEDKNDPDYRDDIERSKRGSKQKLKQRSKQGSKQGSKRRFKQRQSERLKRSKR